MVELGLEPRHAAIVILCTPLKADLRNGIGDVLMPGLNILKQVGIEYQGVDQHESEY